MVLFSRDELQVKLKQRDDFKTGTRHAAKMGPEYEMRSLILMQAARRLLTTRGEEPSRPVGSEHDLVPVHQHVLIAQRAGQLPLGQGHPKAFHRPHTEVLKWPHAHQPGGDWSQIQIMLCMLSWCNNSAKYSTVYRYSRCILRPLTDVILIKMRLQNHTTQLQVDTILLIIW